MNKFARAHSSFDILSKNKESNQEFNCDYCEEKLQTEDVNNSFTEIENEDHKSSQDFLKNNSKKSIQLLLEWESRADIKKIKIRHNDVFPLQIYDS